MRLHAIFAAAVLSAAFALPAGAADTAQHTSMKTCAATWKGMSGADKARSKYTDYMGTCMKAGDSTKTPGGTMAAAPTPPPSMAMTAKPAKSDASMKMAAPAGMKMAAPAGGGSAKCKDGKTVTYKSRSGTCSGHGGVATWM